MGSPVVAAVKSLKNRSGPEGKLERRLFALCGTPNSHEMINFESRGKKDDVQNDWPRLVYSIEMSNHTDACVTDVVGEGILSEGVREEVGYM